MNFFSANHSYNDSNNNLCDLNKLQLPTNSMDTLTQSNLGASNISLNVPSPTTNNTPSSSPQQHNSILLRTPELKCVQEGEIMQFTLPANHQSANYSLNQSNNFNNIRLSTINPQLPPLSNTVHHRTSRCKMALINNQPTEYCNCKNHRHSMFVGNGHLDYANSNKQYQTATGHLHPDELYDDYSIANTHTVDGVNIQPSTSMDAVNNQWLVNNNNKQQHLCSSCNFNHPNYKKSCVSLSEKHPYHLHHQPSCHNLNQLSIYNSQDLHTTQAGNLKNKDYYFDSSSNPKLDREQPKERLTQILGEMIIPFIFAGLGNVATGYMLSNVQHWSVFQNVPQLIILIPALLGLKGNVEMTLASRLSTHANLGHMDKGTDRRKMVIGNMALVQCQSSTVGFLAPLIALAISYINPDENDILTRNEIIL